MRKRASVAALGIRMTALPVLAAILIGSVLQVAFFLASEHLWTAAEYDWAYSFQLVLDGERVAFHGKLSFVWILTALAVTAGSAKSSIGYTIRRLRISENELTVIWALIFSGYYLISWAVQLALVLGMYVRYAQVTGWGEMELFASNFRSIYFHTLLPLSEPLGYVRNIFLCMGWGTMASLIGRYVRHGGKVYLAFVLMIVSGLMLPQGVATASVDMLLILSIVALILVQIYFIREVERNED